MRYKSRTLNSRDKYPLPASLTCTFNLRGSQEREMLQLREEQGVWLCADVFFVGHPILSPRHFVHF